MPLSTVFLSQSLGRTNLDVSNPQPSGGPNNFPNYNHQHTYSPTNTYLNSSTPGGNGSGNISLQSSVNSDFGISNITLKPNNVFKDGTNLDLENPDPLGGPNRHSAGASNIPSGFYQTTTTQGPLMSLSGSIINNMLHQFTPNGTKYEDSFTPDQLPDNSTF